MSGLSSFVQIAHLVARQDPADVNITVPELGTQGFCDNGNDYDSKMPARISSVFVILVGSFMGMSFPLHSTSVQTVSC